MPCITPKPLSTYEEWLEGLLCQACKFLTKEQIISIKDLHRERIGLQEWYQRHLMSDYAAHRNDIDKSHQEYLENEAERMGFTMEYITGGVKSESYELINKL